MERYLVELDEHQLERLRAMVRDAIESANDKEVIELEALLSALNVGRQASDACGLLHQIVVERHQSSIV